jgi:hypothetical protein
MPLMLVLVVASIFFCLYVFAFLSLSDVDRVFLLQVPNFICSLEVSVRGYKCKRAIQIASEWLVGVQVPWS